MDEVSLAILADWWLKSSCQVVLTGAGISTESGLPDFRSAQGLWKGNDPRRVASISALYENPQDFYEFYRMRCHNLEAALPNKGHEVLANLMKARLLKAIITQNVDGFHQRAGASRVIELHGSLRASRCLSCGKRYGSDVLHESALPKCSSCGGAIRPDVVLFGENLPFEAMRQAEIETKRSDLFVVIGSSLEVSPANYFPIMARDRGAKLVIINIESTVMDEEADLVIHGKSGVLLSSLYDLVKKE